MQTGAKLYYIFLKNQSMISEYLYEHKKSIVVKQKTGVVPLPKAKEPRPSLKVKSFKKLVFSNT